MNDVVEQFRRHSRRQIINRMAAAIARTKGREWSRMTPARQDQLRAQARAALTAFRPTQDGDADVDIACASWLGSVVPASPPRLISEVQAWVDEVMK